MILLRGGATVLAAGLVSLYTQGDYNFLSVEEPSTGSAVAKYFRQDDDSFVFVIWDPGVAGTSSLDGCFEQRSRSKASPRGV